MKKKTRVTAALLSALLAAGCFALPMSLAGAEECAVTKDENVFILLNPDGSVKRQTVSDWLHADGGLMGFEDVSSLTGITNLKGSELPDQNGGKLTWHIEGNDVYYQGSTGQTPPVTVRITYALDGVEMQPEEMLGRSGHLTITVSLENHEKESVSVEGKKRLVYTPFVTAVGTNLPVDQFHNVRAEHGTLQTDSNNQIVGFVCLPGMAETFDGLLNGRLSSIQEKFLDQVSIEADVENFTAPSLMIACANDPDLLREDETLQDFDNLLEDLDALKEATQELLDGARQLSDGAASLRAGTDALTEGADSLKAGTDQLKEGTAALDQGLSTLASQNQALNSGASQIFETVLDTVNSQLSQNHQLTQLLGGSIPTLTAANYSQVLDQMLAAFPGAEAVTAQVQAAVEQSIRQNPAAMKAIEEGVTDAALQQAAAAALKQQGVEEPAPEQVAGFLKQYQASLEGSSQFQAGVAAAVEEAVAQQAQAAMAQEGSEAYTALQQALAASGSGAQQLTNLKVQLDSVAAFVKGLSDYTDGVVQAQKGCDSLYQGASQLQGGAAELQNGASQLRDGAVKLQDGAVQLLDGMEAYNTDGISKLTDSPETVSLPELLDVLDAVQAQNEAYTSYTGVPKGADASVKFVMKTESVKEAEEKETLTEPTSVEKPSFWARILNLFGFKK